MLRWGAESAQSLQIAVWNAYKKYTELSVQQKAMRKGKEHSLDKTLMVWAKENKQFQLTMCMHAWSKLSAASRRDARGKNAFASAVKRFNSMTTHSLLSNSFAGWLDICRTNALKQKALLRFARKDDSMQKVMQMWGKESMI